MAHIKLESPETTDAPKGYEKVTEQKLGIFIMEYWGAHHTGEGYRYEL